MDEHTDAAKRQSILGDTPETKGPLTFGKAVKTYRERLEFSGLRPNTKAFREAGLKLINRTWPGIEPLNVRKITSRVVEDWLRKFKTEARPHVPRGAKTPAHNSTGASATTIKCALDAFRQVLDVAVESGHLYANPVRNPTVTITAGKILKAARREKTERGTLRLPTREEFLSMVDAIRNAGVNECRAAADYVQFIAFCGARKNEAIHVLWSDVDFNEGKIRLRVTKNGEQRYVPMTDEMCELLERMKGERHDPDNKETVLLIKEAQGFINSACKKLNIPRFTTHSLRHLFGTACLEAGVDVRTVASWLGHKDNGALLLKVYSHVRKQHEAEMIRKVRFAPSPLTPGNVIELQGQTTA
jgi:integrase